MLKLDDFYERQEDNWVSRFIVDEVVIMPLCRSEEDLQYIYSISNEAGVRIWQLLDGKHSVRDIQDILKSEYQGQGKVIEREALEFLGDLIEVKLIQKVNNGAKKRNQYRTSSIQHPGKKNPYKSPEISKVKMQAEQAVLSCCTSGALLKQFPLATVNVCGVLPCYLCSNCTSMKAQSPPGNLSLSMSS
jgi:hypothetical protein